MLLSPERGFFLSPGSCRSTPTRRSQDSWFNPSLHKLRAVSVVVQILCKLR
jgi:hypothetical protein